MRRLVLALLLVACGAQQNQNDASAEQLASGTRLRLVAANLTSGNLQSYDPGDGKRILQGLHPDVVMLQEFNLTTSLQTFANDICGTTCYVMREAMTGGGNLPNGVVSRYPIKSSGRWVDANVSNRGFAWAQLDIPGTPDLWVVSVHLLTSSAANRDAEATQIKNYLIAQGIPASDYIAIGGDFNTGSRTEAALTTLGAIFTVPGVIPSDGANSNTNSTRSKPYDWVLTTPNLNALQTATLIGNNSFATGLVVDTRVYTPLADLSPALASDSGASNMQHMAVVKDFLLPGGAPPPASVTVLSPNGGESWAAGSTQSITWSASNVAGVKIEYSSDNGANWSTLAASVAASPYAWTVPSAATTAAKIRISDAANAAVSDTSNAGFSIITAPPGSDAFEPDDTADTAKAIVLGTAQTHSIKPASDQDWVTFTLSAPTNVRIETSGPAGGDTFVRLYNAAKTEIGNDDDSGVGYYSLLTKPALAAGTYTVKVTSYNSATTITGYSLKISSY